MCKISVYTIISGRKCFPARLLIFTEAFELEWCCSVKEVGLGFCPGKLGAVRLVGAEKETPQKPDF